MSSAIAKESAPSHSWTFSPNNRRRVLLVFPRYSHSFGTFNHAFDLVGVKAFMPPQGLLLMASLLPAKWETKFVDENIAPASPEDFAWADAVFISGMHIQKAAIEDINRRAHRAGKITALGGPSVSAVPEYYPEVDLLHCGEAGDGTLRLFQHLSDTIERPGKQLVFRTTERLDLAQFPAPAYHLIDLRLYLTGSVQFSSGCPYCCEFCDIPGLYGRNPRVKTPEQVLRELDQLLAGGANAVYFVDDNFIANPKAATDLLSHLVRWQQRHDYRMRLSCEATLNLSGHPQILELMRQAFFITVFCGIETPQPAALRAMKKTQNLRKPILESVAIMNRHGLEVASGIILGLDTDTAETAEAITEFANESQIPIMTVNLLFALPQTPLHERLRKAGRLVPDEGRDSNIAFLEPYETVVERWRRVIAQIYEPANLFARFATQAAQTYPNRCRPANPWSRLNRSDLSRAWQILRRIIWRVGIRSNYRRQFWQMFRSLMRRGDLENTFHIAAVAHHLITYAQSCTQGKMQASNYSRRTVENV
ncbi:MAG TPA: B12-binding domain-containing radical SAM protein [Candidatus Binatia bacterium]|jgi:radical SAM superfamily enzyme YgiQ (UPF0313 family)|nr:B12-binding domain-containing radical SAM protein [Candidatus Binatia bacterium]